MPTTTYETIRDAMIVAVNGKTPTSRTDVPFRVSRAEMPLDEWADANPGACFRRFAIGPALDDEEFQVSNLDVREEVVTCSVTICYPNDYRYGIENRRDMHDIIREDHKSLLQVIGPEGGFRSFADASIRFLSSSTEDIGPVSIRTLDLQIRYYRSMP